MTVYEEKSPPGLPAGERFFFALGNGWGIQKKKKKKKKKKERKKEKENEGRGKKKRKKVWGGGKLARRREELC